MRSAPLRAGLVVAAGASPAAQALLGEQPTAEDIRKVDKLLKDFEYLGFIEPCDA